MHNRAIRFKPWVLLISAASVIATIALCISIVIPLMNTNKTNSSSVEVNSGVQDDPPAAGLPVPPTALAGAAAKLAEHVLDNSQGLDDLGQHSPVSEDRPGEGMWVVELSKPLADFPLELDAVEQLSCIGKGPDCLNRPACTDAQLEWLTKNARKAGIWAFNDTLYLAASRIRNTATSGSVLTVSDFKLDLIVETISDDSIYISCQAYTNAAFGAATGSRVSRPALFTLGSSSTALFGGFSQFGVDATRQVPEGQPATVNLEPGQDVLLDFSASIPHAMAIEGSITAMASSGGESVPVKISDEKYGAGISAAIPGRRDVIWTIVSGAPCPTPVNVNGSIRYGDSKDCTLEAMLTNHGLN
ncbi:hypothetical protein [Arthrobacter sp. HY1533]|uniref:hypothetical protein n=1 Tax=Arthrobacter sp. HY1533 TaxID=2970919 RepID=UPI0022B9DDA9|nr:hypothetical protein [Arthrobacter sp. HY1533]